MKGLSSLTFGRLKQGTMREALQRPQQPRPARRPPHSDVATGKDDHRPIKEDRHSPSRMIKAGCCFRLATTTSTAAPGAITPSTSGRGTQWMRRANARMDAMEAELEVLKRAFVRRTRAWAEMPKVLRLTRTPDEIAERRTEQLLRAQKVVTEEKTEPVLDALTNWFRRRDGTESAARTRGAIPLDQPAGARMRAP
jgi:hypothetical protein